MKEVLENIREIYIDIKGGKCDEHKITEIYKSIYIDVPLQSKIKAIRRFYNKNKQQ